MDEEIRPLMGGGEVDANRLIFNDYGLAFEMLLLSFIAVFAFFSASLHAVGFAPWVFFLLLIFCARTSPWKTWQTGLALFVAYTIPMMTFISIHSVAPLLITILGLFLIGGVVVDRLIYLGLNKWAVRTFRRTTNRGSLTLRMMLYFRQAMSILFFPLFYVGFFTLVDYLPSPLDAGSLANFGLAEIRNDVRMLAAVGGLPLVSFTICLFATVVVTILISYRIERRGPTEWRRIRDGQTRLFEPSVTERPVYEVSHDVHSFGSKRTEVENMYKDIGMLLRKSPVFWGVIAVSLIALGPLMRVLFNGAFPYTSRESLASGQPTVRMACAPKGRFEDLGRAAKVGAQLVMTGECVGPCKEKLGMRRITIGSAFHDNETGGNVFVITEPNGREVLKHQKFRRMPFESLKPGKREVTMATYDFGALPKLLGTNTAVNSGESNKDGETSKDAEMSEDSETKDVETDKKDVETDKKDVETDKKDSETDKKDSETDKKDVEIDENDVDVKEAEVKDVETNQKDFETSKHDNTANSGGNDNEDDTDNATEKDDGGENEGDTNSGAENREDSTGGTKSNSDAENEKAVIGGSTGGSEHPRIRGAQKSAGEITQTEDSHKSDMTVTIGSAICMDMYGAAEIATAGKGGVDLMMVPSQVWGNLHTAHSSVLRMRAIENGFVLFTCTYDGISGVFGPFGETYAQSYATDGLLVYDVPIHPQRHAWKFMRIYPYIATQIGWLCFMGAIVFGLLGIIMPS